MQVARTECLTLMPAVLGTIGAPQPAVRQRSCKWPGPWGPGALGPWGHDVLKRRVKKSTARSCISGDRESSLTAFERRLLQRFLSLLGYAEPFCHELLLVIEGGSSSPQHPRNEASSSFNSSTRTWELNSRESQQSRDTRNPPPLDGVQTRTGPPFGTRTPAAESPPARNQVERAIKKPSGRLRKSAS